MTTGGQKAELGPKIQRCALSSPINDRLMMQERCANSCPRLGLNLRRCHCLHSNGSGLIKIEFTEACNWLPTVFEYYARDPNVPFKEGAPKGLLTYRTATTWTKVNTQGAKLCPTFIVLEIFSDNQYETIAISSAWKIDLKRNDFSEDCINQPAGDNPLGNLFRELSESLEVMRKKQAVSGSTKKK